MDLSNYRLTAADRALLKRVRNTLLSAALLPGDRPVIIAVSGGADSVSLLHILTALFPATKHIAVYVDHGLRPLETGAETKLVQQQAALCSAQFVSTTVDVQREKEEKKSSLEEAARTLRYQELERICDELKAGAIAVGHTADDQAEEVLLRLIRGSGSTGLSGMSIRNRNIIRPLLHETKESLLSFLKSQNIPFCEDSSNTDRRFLRNRIRQDLLPQLEKRYNRSMRQTLLQTAAILKEEDALLTALTNSAVQEMVHKDGKQITLDLTQFSMTHPAVQRRILEKICWQMASRPSFKKIKSLQRLAAARESSEVHLSKGLRAIKQAGSILFHFPSQKKGYRGPALMKKRYSPLRITGPGRYQVAALQHELVIEEIDIPPETIAHDTLLLLDAATIQLPLTLRPHIPGERFHPLGAPGRKKISSFLADQKIPALERQNYPVLLSSNTIIAIIGLRINHEHRVTSKTKKTFCLRWETTAG